MQRSREPRIESLGNFSAPTMREYALSHQLSENQVWEMIEEGEISARFLNDEIHIFREPDAETKTDRAPTASFRERLSGNLDLNDLTPDLGAGDKPENNEITIQLLRENLRDKEELLSLKSEKILILEEKIVCLEEKIRQLKRENENLATLQRISNNPNILRTLLPSQK